VKVVLRIRWDMPWLDDQGRDRFPKRCTPAWQQLRLALFMRYTLPALQRQTHADWEAWLLADQANLHMHPTMVEPRVRFVYNFKDACAKLGDAGNDVFFMRIDSDDILAPDALAAFIHHAKYLDSGNYRYLQFGDGYAWHTASERIYTWNNPSPPFYGYVAPAAVLETNVPSFGHHAEARTMSYVIHGPMYCVVMHGDNISNQPSRAWCKGPLDGPECGLLIERFGLLAAAL